MKRGDTMIRNVFFAAVHRVRDHKMKLHFTKKSGIIAAGLVITVAVCIPLLLNRVDDGEVDALAVSLQYYEEKIVAAGQLQLAREATLIAEVSGEILSIGAEEGDIISAGSAIISIDDSGQSYQLEQKKFNYDNAGAEYQNLVELEYESAKQELAGQTAKKEQAQKSYHAAEKLYQEGALSQLDYLQYKSDSEAALAAWNKAELKVRSLSASGAVRISAYSQLQSAQSSYESALNDQKKYQIAAPWDAVLLKTYVSEHDFVQPGDSLADIGEAGSYHVVVELDEKYFPYLSEGMRAIISLDDSASGKGAEGRVDVMSRKINDETGTFEIKVAIPEEFPFQASNLTVNVEIIAAERENTVVIPREYLIDGEPAVYIYQDGRAVKTKIEYEERPSSKLIVTKGLTEGNIIVKPDSSVQDGGTVEIKKGVEAS
ncbi:MAG: efflux RND transporter periplasmic adaptor subunit [Eubacteriales bacterium]|nr:efflux RND transporter periplasmic adaptor subunit [Eubacteriales bacterium]